MVAPSKGTLVVTGASSGIGEACALHFDRLGFDVFAGVRTEAAAQALREKASRRLRPLHLDVTEEKTVAQAAESVARAVEKEGLAGLVNNAGIMVPGPVELLSPSDLRRQFGVNLFGPVSVTQAFLPLLRQGRGRIVNVGSISGRSAMPFAGAYAGSKFALEALTDALRVELLPWGISVSIVEPAAVATPLFEKFKNALGGFANSRNRETARLYQSELRAVRARSLRSVRLAMPMQKVIGAIEHALTSRRPKARYVVGKNARMMLLLESLPVRLRDRLIRMVLDHYARLDERRAGGGA